MSHQRLTPIGGDISNDVARCVIDAEHIETRSNFSDLGQSLGLYDVADLSW